MSQNTQNPFSMWMDMNKGMLDTWNTWATQMTPQAVTEAANPVNTYFEFFTKNFSQNPVFSYMTGGNSMEQMYKQWQDNMKNMSMYIPNQSIRDGFDRFLNSYQLFSGLQNHWDAFLKNMPTNITDWEAFARPVMKNYQDMAGSFMQPFMPEQLKGFFIQPFENVTAMQNSIVDFFKPWLENSATAQGNLLKALTGDKDAYLEFMNAWSEIYKNSYSKVLHMPVIGSNRTSVEKMMKLLDHYVNFVAKMNEYTLMISNLLSDTMEKLLKHLAELQAEGKQPQTFMEFYKLWSHFNEQAFGALFATDEFSKIMNEAISAGSKLKIIYNDFVQDILEVLPLPNRRELDSVEEEIYNLRKRVKAQEKEIKLLKEKLETKA